MQIQPVCLDGSQFGTQLENQSFVPSISSNVVTNFWEQNMCSLHLFVCFFFFARQHLQRRFVKCYCKLNTSFIHDQINKTWNFKHLTRFLYAPQVMRYCLTSTLWAKPHPSDRFSSLHLQTYNLDMCKASNRKTKTQEVVETTAVLIKTWLTSTSCQLPNERQWCTMPTTCLIWCNLTRSARQRLAISACYCCRCRA